MVQDVALKYASQACHTHHHVSYHNDNGLRPQSCKQASGKYFLQVAVVSLHSNGTETKDNFHLSPCRFPVCSAETYHHPAAPARVKCAPTIPPQISSPRLW